MPTVIWKFGVRANRLERDLTGELIGTSISLELPTHEEVKRLASDADFEIKGWVNDKDRMENVRIEVEEPPDSPRLARILSLIEERYGFKPWPHAVFDNARSHEHFGVQRIRSFTKKEINQAELLSFAALGSIGHAAYREEELFAKDQYIVQDFKKLKKQVGIGMLQPFHGMAVSTNMKELLEEKQLVGLDMSSEVIGSNGNLWKFGSSIILPRCLTRVVNGQGQDVDPDVWKVVTINGDTEDHLFDDGHRPALMRYRREDIEQFGPFDVAFEHEFIGNHRNGAYRSPVVSQRFRAALKELGIRRTWFVPVVLE